MRLFYFYFFVWGGWGGGRGAFIGAQKASCKSYPDVNS